MATKAAEAAPKRPRRAPVKKPPVHPLAHLIPPAEVAEDYVGRLIYGIEDMELLAYAKESHKSILLTGPTGNGKTKMLSAFCAKNGIPMVTVQCNGGIDPQTIWGGLVVDQETGLIKGWQDSEVTDVVHYGGLLYLNEVNFVPPKTLATLYPLLDFRRQLTILEKGNETIKAHDDLIIVADGNPDYEGTRPLNAAFKNRFALKFDTDYDSDIEDALVYTDTIKKVAEDLRKAHREGTIETPISTNLLMEFEEHAIDLGTDWAIMNFVANFAEDEKDPIKERLQLSQADIDAEIQEVVARFGEDDDEDVDEEDVD